MTHKSAEEQLDGYLASMGADLGPIFHHCRQNFLSITSLWDTYCILFGNSERVKLLNSSSSLLFYHVHWQFLGGVSLGLLRLLEPSKTLGKSNLSLPRLAQLCDRSLQPKLQTRLDQILEMAVSLKAFRDKRIAHNDLQHALGEVEPLKLKSREEITEIFRFILRFLNDVEVHYSGSSTFLIPLGNNAGFQLLFRLLKAEQVMAKSRESGMVETFEMSRSEVRETPISFRATSEEQSRYG